MLVPFAAWRPDIADFDVNYCDEVSNVIPAVQGYRPFEAFEAKSTSAVARPQGVISVRAKDGSAHTFYGDATKLYKLSGDGMSWADVSRTSGGAYTTLNDGFWTFAKFGNDLMAMNGIDADQVFVLGTSTNFAALAGTPPIAQFAGVVRGFAVAARLSTDFSSLAWSAIENNHDWVPSATTLSDTQEFPDGGEITGFVGGEVGIVFQENAIQRMAFEGPPVAFRFDKISIDMGCSLKGSIAAYADRIFFRGDDGFYLLAGGQQIVPIGDEKVDRWFDATIDIANKHKVSSAIDPVRKLYLLSFVSLSSPDGNPDIVIGFHWPSGEWTKIDASFAALFLSLGTRSYTVDALDILVDDTAYDIYPVDSDYWSGKAKATLGGFNGSFASGTFTGGSMAAYVETKDFQITPGRKTLLRGFRPLIEGDTMTASATVFGGDFMHQSKNDYGPFETNELGYVPCRVNERYHRVGLAIPAGETWAFIRGIDDLKFSKMGTR